MMTQVELYQGLQSIELPVAYGSFASAPPPPFLIYQFAYSSDLMADDQNYVKISNYQVELYTDRKDPAAEKSVQDKLRSLGLPCSKVEVWLPEEKLYQIIFGVQIMEEE